MIRYAIDDNSNFALKVTDKYLSVIVTKPYQEPGFINTGIYLWADDGTVLLANMFYAHRNMEVLPNKGELIVHINPQIWPQPFLRPGTEIAQVIPLASAYYGNIELEQIRTEWFSQALL